MRPIFAKPSLYHIFYESSLLLLHAGENEKSVSFVTRVQQRIKVDILHSVNNNRPTSTPYSSKTKGVSPPQMRPKRSSNASALVQSNSQVRRPLRYGATGVQSHPILVTVTACQLDLPLLPSEGQPLTPNVLLQHYFTPTLEIPRQFCLLD